MTQDPRPPVIHKTEERHTVVRDAPSGVGYALVAVLVVLAVLFGAWLLASGGGEGGTETTQPVIETTLPEGTIPSP